MMSLAGLLDGCGHRVPIAPVAFVTDTEPPAIRWQVGDQKALSDRLAPGKGTIQWREVLSLLAEKNYTGYLSYEAPNPDLWARSPYEVAREGVELTRGLLRGAIPAYAA